jgi:hypothetical protein
MFEISGNFLRGTRRGQAPATGVNKIYTGNPFLETPFLDEKARVKVGCAGNFRVILKAPGPSFGTRAGRELFPGGEFP